MSTELAPLLKGRPLVLKVKNVSGASVFDFSTNPVYLFIENIDTDQRTVFQYVPGGGSNDGVYSLESGIQYVTFRKPSEWTRIETNLPVGQYSVWAYLGALTGYTGMTPDKGLMMQVCVPETGLPFAS